MRSLGGRTVDILVIGGGIIGAGVARDAGADDPPADDEEIDGAAAERPHRLLACSYLFALLYLSI